MRQYATSFRNYPVQNRVERGRLTTCGCDSIEISVLQEYYEGSKKSEEMLVVSRRILDKLKK